MDTPVLRCRQRQQQVNGLHPCHRREDFLKVNSFALDEAPDNEQRRLALGNGAALVLLHLVHAFEPNWPTPER